MGVKKYLESVGLEISSSLFPPVLTMGRPEFTSSIRLPEKIDLNGKMKDGFTYRILTQKSHLLSPLIVSVLSRVPFTQVDLDKKEWVKTLVAGSYDLTLMGFGLTIRDWDAISIWFESGAHYNFAKLKNESVDNLLRLAREEVEPVKRLKYYSELLKLNDKEKWYVPVTNIPLSVGLAEGIEYLGSRQHLISSPFIDLNKIKLVDAAKKAGE
jgi:ABC-type transport system substrate-binding protein